MSFLSKRARNIGACGQGIKMYFLSHRPNPQILAEFQPHDPRDPGQDSTRQRWSADLPVSN
jgi:hypothetical protein